LLATNSIPTTLMFILATLISSVRQGRNHLLKYATKSWVSTKNQLFFKCLQYCNTSCTSNSIHISTTWITIVELSKTFKIIQCTANLLLFQLVCRIQRGTNTHFGWRVKISTLT